MFLDATTQRNLELTHNLTSGSTEETLLWVLDETLTPMGGRFLRSSIMKPLIDINEIRQRIDAVEYLTDDFELLEELRTSFRRIQDVERLTTRINAKTANARDTVAIKISIVNFPNIKKSLNSANNAYLRSMAENISEFPALKELIEKTIPNTPPI